MEHCSEISKFTLMTELPWYKYKFYLCLLVGTFITLIVPSNHKIVYLVLFNVIAIISDFVIDYLASEYIDKNRLTELINRCQVENNVKKEHFLSKLKDLSFEDANQSPKNVLTKEEKDYFNERGSVSIGTIKNMKDCNKNLNDKPEDAKDTHIEKFGNPVNESKDPKIAGDFRDNVSMNSFKNELAAFESTYEMIQTPPIPTPPPQVNKDGCLMGKDNCNPICSGNNENSCNLQTSIPGPQWQPQKANAVQNRLNNGEFVPNYCPL